MYSFANDRSTEFVGFDNYTNLLASPSFQNTLFNTFLWILLVPAGSIVLGLLIATLADRLRPRGEKISKTLIFLPMAIGGVSAGAIWRFVYAANPPTQNQIGLLNGIVTGFGGEPVNWLQISDFRFNSLLLMVMLLWMQAGFAMVLLSAAIKGVPTETLEAARLDGAGEGAIFFRIVIPQIRTTLITVFITVLIGVLKTFDIVYVMTNGNFNTNVIARRLLQPVVHQPQRRLRRGDRRHAADHHDPGPGLPGPSVPCRGGRPMSGTQAVTATPVQLPKQPAVAGQQAKRQGTPTRQVAALGADRPGADLPRLGRPDARAGHHLVPAPGRRQPPRAGGRSSRRRPTSPG